jgi:Zn-dependent M28 family amino/carboxypeptidase
MINPRLQHHIAVLGRDIGERNVFRPPALHAAADYIATEWQRHGYDVQRDGYPVNGVTCENLSVTRLGSKDPNDILIIGAHYDSVVGSPGANDNGTGIAALLEISRRFAAISPTCSIRFVAFVNEEPPFFMTDKMGSRVYARAARSRGDKIRLMACLETIGCYRIEPDSQQYPPLLRPFYPRTGNFIAFVSNFRSRHRMLEAVRAFRTHSDFPLQHLTGPSFIPGLAWSDHWSFWQEGYRAFMVTDTAFYRYPWYHTAQDTPDKIDYAAFSAVTDALFQTIIALAGQIT